MAKLNFTANPNFTPAKTAYSLITPGDYVVQVVESEVKATRSGKALSLTFQVVDDSSFRNRRVWVLLNLDHPDEAVVARAYGELQSLCKAVGFAGELEDTSALHDKPLTARIYETKPKDGYEAKNSANRYRPANWLYPPAPAPAPAEQATAPVEQSTGQTSMDRARAMLAAHRAKQESDAPF